jgi:hypothetical protein
MNDRTNETPKTVALALYGQRGEVKELSDRILKMLPGVRQLGEAGALALAQVAYSMGLNPFTGEVWAIPIKDKSTGRVVGFSIMAGIKGLRRAAKIQAKENGGIYPFYRPSFRLMTDEEKELADLKKGDKGLVCELEVFLPPIIPGIARRDTNATQSRGWGSGARMNEPRWSLFR